MERKIKMDKKTCLHCGYQWIPRIETQPKACPRCKSPRWAEEPRKAGRPKGRINQFFADLRKDGLDDYEIAAGLGNGDIERPEWLAIAESTDHLKAWDNETDACAQWGFVTIRHSNDD
jgi:ribosomal protein L37E